MSKAELSAQLATLYKTEKDRVVTFGFRTQFGGGRSTGFALIYDNEAVQRKFEPRYRLIRVGFCSVFIVGYAGHSRFLFHSQDSRQRLRKRRVNYGKSVRIVRRRFVIFDLFCSFKTATHFRAQVRGTKKLKAAEPPKKGK